MKIESQFLKKLNIAPVSGANNKYTDTYFHTIFFFFSITYHCPVGEMPIGKVIQTCQNTGNWSGMPIGCKRVECGQVPGLANGEIHVLDGRTTYGARVRYKCKTDYSLIGGKNKIIYIKTREKSISRKKF